MEIMCLLEYLLSILAKPVPSNSDTRVESHNLCFIKPTVYMTYFFTISKSQINFLFF